MRRYYYLVSYAFGKKELQAGLGSAQISSHCPVTDWSDIERFTALIKTTLEEGMDVTILSYQLVREDPIW